MGIVSLALRREPLAAFGAIADEPGAVFLEVPDPEHPMTLLACRPVAEQRISDHETDPFGAVADFVDAQPVGDPAMPLAVRSGVVGFLTYEAGRGTAPHARRHASTLPLALLRRYDPIVVFDHTRQRWVVSSSAANPRAEWLDRLHDDRPIPIGPLAHDDLAADLDPATYRAGVARIKEYLAAGDIYQANLTQPFRTRLAAPPWALFLELQRRHPARHAAYLDAGDFQILMNSPELFLRRRGGRVETKPIKGTRPRGLDPATDTQLAAELAADPKECAEHVMIVDLERNDLGRVSRTGSVSVEHFARVVSLPTVHHLVSTVRGELRQGVGLSELLAATFPGGSITGAPKVRSMEIIAELEREARGIYTGALGLFDPGGDLELGLPIRTAIVEDGRLTYRAGGGIVADSDPDRELAECWTKTAGLRRVLGEPTLPTLDRCSSG